ncbi:MAG TPA: response regulator [Acetobacteraceae bacterium]|nr:response regulator [Acetobacteraceae bacterium]
MNADTPTVLLVVEDDELVRLTLVEGLGDAGFDVVEAEDAEAALSLLSEKPEISALLTDINLPGADGFVLARAARRLRPNLPVVYASGRIAEAVPGRALPDAPFLAKPFTPAFAAAAITEAISRNGY